MPCYLTGALELSPAFLSVLHYLYITCISFIWVFVNVCVSWCICISTRVNEQSWHHHMKCDWLGAITWTVIGFLELVTDAFDCLKANLTTFWLVLSIGNTFVGVLLFYKVLKYGNFCTVQFWITHTKICFTRMSLPRDMQIHCSQVSSYL